MRKLFCLFGATGDLAKRKIFPALNNIPDVDVLAIGRRYMSQEDFKINFVKSSKLHERVRYKTIDYSNKDCYEQIIKEAAEYDEVVFYLSTPPSLFFDCIAGLSVRKLKNSKIAFEKPFGHDMKSFEELNKKALENFTEEQIYRVDHYLGKNAVLEILKFRKEQESKKYWDAEFIKEIKIIASESLGIETRAGYYEGIGAVNDMIQSHLLQILSITCMDLNDNKKEEIIKNIQIKDVALGQYKGYLKETGVREDSKTETLAKVELEINTPKWAGVEITLFTGKKLRDKKTQVEIKFKDSVVAPNNLIFEIAPEEKIIIDGKETPLQDNIDDGYKNIINGIFDNKKEMFAGTKELEASWKIVEEIEDIGRDLIIYPDRREEKDF